MPEQPWQHIPVTVLPKIRREVARVYINGKLVHQVVGRASETADQLRARVLQGLVIAVVKE